SAMDQPITLLDQASKTTARYTFPSRAACSVMSATHKPVGAGWMELAVDQIVGGLSTRIPAGCAMTAATPVYPFDPSLTHQPFHPLAGDGDVLAQSELGPDPW